VVHRTLLGVFLPLRWHPRITFVLQALPRTGATLANQKQVADASAKARPKPPKVRAQQQTTQARAAPSLLQRPQKTKRTKLQQRKSMQH
jgi:hypothetical protein